MTSPSASVDDSFSGPRSHVFVLLIDDDDSEDVLKILDSLRRHRGWLSTGFGFNSSAAASLVAECSSLTLRRFDPVLSREDSIHPSQYPIVERNLTLLTPDLPDVSPVFLPSGSSGSVSATRGSAGSLAGLPQELTSYSDDPVSDDDFDINSDGLLASGSYPFDDFHMSSVLAVTSVGSATPSSRVLPNPSSSSGFPSQPLSVRERVRLMRLRREESQ